MAPAAYLNIQHWRSPFLEIQMYLPLSQADFVGVQDGLVHIQLNSGDQLKKGSLTPPPSFLLLAESGRFSVHRVSATLFCILQLHS